MADERFTHSGRKVPNYDRILKPKTTGPYTTASMELDLQVNQPRPTTSKLMASLNVNEFFATDNEFSSHKEQASGSERSIEE